MFIKGDQSFLQKDKQERVQKQASYGKTTDPAVGLTTTTLTVLWMWKWKTSSNGWAEQLTAGELVTAFI